MQHEDKTAPRPLAHPVLSQRGMAGPIAARHKTQRCQLIAQITWSLAQVAVLVRHLRAY